MSKRYKLKLSFNIYIYEFLCIHVLICDVSHNFQINFFLFLVIQRNFHFFFRIRVIISLILGVFNIVW